MPRLTSAVIRHRWPTVAAWIILFLLGGLAAANLGPLLSNRFSVPGSDSERGLNILRDHLHERADGAFTMVVQSTGGPLDPATVASAAARGARLLANGKAGPVQQAAPTVDYVQLNTSLENTTSSNKTPAIRQAIGHIPGAKVYLTGFPALNHDEQPLYSQDLAFGELVALPIAMIVLGFMFATLGGILIPVAFALLTIPTTLGGVWIVAHFMSMATYVQNIVELIGLAIAIDYS